MVCGAVFGTGICAVVVGVSRFRLEALLYGGSCWLVAVGGQAAGAGAPFCAAVLVLHGGGAASCELGMASCLLGAVSVLLGAVSFP